MPPSKQASPRRAHTQAREKEIGRPSKRTPEARERILEAVRVGASMSTAATAAGLTYETFDEWRKSDSDFAGAIERARAELEIGLLEKIEAAAAQPKTWQAATWLLEHLLPDRYALKRLEVTGKGGGPIEHDVRTRLAELSVDELRKLAEA